MSTQEEEPTPVQSRGNMIAHLLIWLLPCILVILFIFNATIFSISRSTLEASDDAARFFNWCRAYEKTSNNPIAITSSPGALGSAAPNAEFRIEKSGAISFRTPATGPKYITGKIVVDKDGYLLGCRVDGATNWKAN